MSAPAATAQRPAPTREAFLLFGLLVVATVGAFFVTQRLKRSPPVVRRVQLPLYISPNGDGRKDRVRIGFFLPKPDRVTVAMVDGRGDEIRRLLNDRQLARGMHHLRWAGRENSGRVAPDGTYYLRVTLRDQGRAATVPRGIQLVTKPPRPRLVSVTPARVPPGGGHAVTIRYSGSASPPAVYSVYRTAASGQARLVDRFAGAPGSRSGQWNGRDRRGRPAPPGTYAFAVTVENRALVAGSAPARLPPRARAAVRGTGVTVAGPQASASLEPVRAGAAVPVALSGARGRVRWQLARVGARRALASGRGRAPALRVRVPRRAATGLYVVRVRTAAGRAAVPLAVRGAGGGGRVLVVLPAISWQGLNPVDADADGFPDTLATAPSVALDRPFALGRPPAALRSEAAPLLAFLDGRRERYDLTTDLALARGHGPALAGHRGVLFAGSARWLTGPLDGRLRAYVGGGGRLASFGTDAFRRTVALTPNALADPGAPQRTNAFGEQVAPAASEAAPLVVHADALGLFAASGGFVGLFTRFEQQQALVRGAHVLSAAGRSPQHPAFVAYRLGRGTVVRVGTPEWARALARDAKVQAVTRATWDFLSR